MSEVKNKKERNVLFSAAFRGYRRQDVNRYLAEENARFTEKEIRLTSEVRSLEARIAKLEEELRAESALTEEKSREYDRLRAECDGELRDLKTAHEEELARIEDLGKSELDRIRAEYELSLREKDVEISRIEESGKSEISRIRSEYELQLREKDEEILSREKQNEDALASAKADYERRLEERNEELVSCAYRLKNNLEKQLRVLVKRCLREVMWGVSDIKRNADRMAEQSQARANRINESIDAYEAQMKDEVRRIVNEFG